MPESKIDITERLRAEGRWELASAYREQERIRLRGEGLSRHEANQQAWTTMLERYPPVEGLNDTPDGSVDVALNAPLRAVPDIDADTIWVYERMGCPLHAVGKPPGGGALALLKWAKANPSLFYREFATTTLGRVRPKPPTEPDEMSNEELAHLVAEFVGSRSCSQQPS